jgi:hypothetical protein
MTNTKYSLNEIYQKSYLSSYKDEDGNIVYFSNYNSSADSSFPPINNVNPLEVLKEMNYVIVPYTNKHTHADKRKYLFYLFMININTKYLVVSSTYTIDIDYVIKVLKYMKYNFNIEHIRGDYDTAFTARKTYKYLNDNSIRYYFTKFKYTNGNRVVDRVIRTIRDMVDRLDPSAFLFNEKHVQDVVHLYNHTKHYAYNSKFTPAQAQHNPEVETWFKCKQESKLSDIDLSPFKGYKEGNFLLVHMPYKEINYKRRRTFNELVIFRGYRGGNVLVELCVPSNKLKNNKTEYCLYVLPMYLPDVKNYYNRYLK